MTAELTRSPATSGDPAPPTPCPAPALTAVPASVETQQPARPRGSADRLLDQLEDLVRRHRALAGGDAAADALHTELIAAELEQQLAVLRRMPPHRMP
ncbi:hypothetical protein [Pseudonocardia phyllosphaerae]|uniref:hypothetical protein n=1 Tax=Pseudonocardia phyllosphaerae TaxID=3390502 RepID=UPI003978D1E6